MYGISLMHSRVGRQHGMALVISLVILVLLTILGVSALNMTNLRSLITRNDQQKQQAFEAAESALKIGLMTAQNLVNPPISNGVLGDGSSYTGVYYSADKASYDSAAKATYKDVSTLAWTDSDSIVAANGRFIIEYLGERPAAGAADMKVLYYRVVAQSSAGGIGTNTLLEGTLGVAKGP